MRVSNRLIASTVNSNLFKNTDRLLELQTMVSSGKRVNKPSDDPISMGRILDYRKTLASVDQYERNISNGESWLNLTDSVLGGIGDLIIRAKELAIYQASDTNSTDDRLIASEEVKNIFDQVMAMANTKQGNSYLFAGFNTDTAPFERDDFYNITHFVDNGDIDIIVGVDVRLNINTNGDDAFIDNVNIFQVIRDLNTALEADDTTAISNQIDELDDALNQVLIVRANTGARLNRLESTENHWADFKLNVQAQLSDEEDADIMKVVSDMVAQEAAYKASLAASAKIIQPSLIDFIR